MAVSVDQFVRHLLDSGLMQDDELAAFCRTLPQQPDTVEELARTLIQAGKLTKYQAAALYQGKTTGLVLGNYVILDQLGEGGMGQVFKARHTRMDRLVALKVLSPRVSKDAGAVKRFLREVKAAAKLSHPNIVAAHDADEAAGTHFLVMEHVAGEDLAQFVRQVGPLPPRQAMECILQAARGLSYAHGEGVIHRDIKPSNLLLDEKGRVKVLDMGLARLDTVDPNAATGEDLTETGSVMGTIDYMAPEQAANSKTADARSDIYSLGCTLHYLLTARPPYQADTIVSRVLAHREQPIPSLFESRPDVPVELDAIFQKMLAKEQLLRYQTMQEVVADLESIVGTSGPSTGMAAPATPAEDDSQLLNFLAGLSQQTAATVTAKKTKQAAETMADVSVDATVSQQPALVTTTTAPRAARRSSRGLFIAGTCTAVALAIGLIVMLTGDGNEPTDDPGENVKVTSPQDGTTSPHNYALNFDGIDDYVDIPTLQYQGGHPLTIEARVRLATDSEPYAVIVWPGNFPMLQIDGMTARADDSQFYKCFWGERHIREKTVNLAGVYDGKTLLLFINGKRADESPQFKTDDAFVPMSEPLVLSDQFATTRAFIGSNSPTNPVQAFRHFFKGIIDEVRISNTARYNKDYKPSKRLDSDEHTLALYHFDEGEGDQLKDASGNNHHGTIHGANWVNADGTPIEPPANYALTFDGIDDYVDIPTLRYDGTHPVTLEAYVRPASNSAGPSTFVASYGNRISLIQSGRRWTGAIAPTADALLNVNAIDTIGTNDHVHLSVVFDGSEMRLYRNGIRLEVNDKWAKGNVELKLPIRPSGSVPGNATTIGAFLRPAVSHFNGIIDEVRISKTARYDKDYTPAKRFTPDEHTLALYHFDEGDGTELKDASGNNHHGTIVGANWVNADGTPTDSARQKAIDLIYQHRGTLTVTYESGLEERQVTRVGEINDDEWNWLIIDLDSADALSATDLQKILAAIVNPFSLYLPARGSTSALLPVVLASVKSVDDPSFVDDGADRKIGRRHSGLIFLGLPDDAEDKHLGMLSELRWIDGFQLNGSRQLTDAGLRNLIEHPNARRFRVLLAYSTQVTDKSVIDLVNVAQHIRVLNLGITGITDACLPILGKLTELRNLHASNTSITDEGLAALDESSLVLLNVANTNVTQTGITRFRDKHLDCKIIWDGGTIEPGESPTNHALQFDGKDDHVEVPTFNYDGSHPITLEATVRIDKIEDSNGEIACLPEFRLARNTRYFYCRVMPDEESTHALRAEGRFKSDQQYHVAAVYNGSAIDLFVNGVRQTKGRRSDSNDNEITPEQQQNISLQDSNEKIGLYIGSTNPLTNSPNGIEHFSGTIDELRISKTARYTKDFKPATRFDTDQHTLALYHFDEGDGDQLKDASGNNHHGKIHGANWVNADGTPTNAARQKAIDLIYQHGGTLAVVNETEGEERRVTRAGEINREEWNWLQLDLGDAVSLSPTDLQKILGAVYSPFVLYLPNQGSTSDLLAVVLASVKSVDDQVVNDNEDRKPGQRHSGIISLGLPNDAEDRHLGMLSKLRWLDGLQCNGSQQITDAGLRNLIKHPNAARFRSLLASSTHVTDQAIIEFVSVAQHMRVLNLGSTGITDACLPTLGKLSGLRSLRALSTSITDEGLTALDECSLALLHVANTNVTQTGITRFRSKHPDCTIIWDGGTLEPGEFPINHALQFDGESSVDIPSFRYDGSHPFTLEMWVAPDSTTDLTRGIISTGGPLRLVQLKDWSANVLTKGDDYYLTVGDTKPVPQKLAHLAVVYDGQQVSLFVDGVAQSGYLHAVDGKLESVDAPLKLKLEDVRSSSRTKVGVGFLGKIDELRISKTARYTKDFKPATRFDTDQHTIALYHFDEGEGDQLKDASGNNHHGKIHGAKWVPSPLADSDTAALFPAGPAGEVKRLQLNRASALALRFATNGKSLFTIGRKEGVELIDQWDLQAGQILRRFETASLHAPDRSTIDVSPDGRFLAGPGEDWKVRVWNVATGALVHEFSLGDKPARDDKSLIEFVRFSPDSARLVAARSNRAMYVFDINAKRQIHVYKADATINDAIFNSVDRRQVVATWGTALRFWNPETNDVQARKLTGGNAIAMAANAPLIGVAKRSNEVNDGFSKLVKYDSTDEPITLDNDKSVFDIALTPNGRFAVTTLPTGEARVWDVIALKVIYEFSPGIGTAVGVDLSPDGRLAATSYFDDKSVRIWRLPEIVRELGGY